MNYDETGDSGPAFEVIGPLDGDVEDLIRAYPDWSDERIAQELSKTGDSMIDADQVADARSRAWKR